jgi:hypothetical protein
MRLLLLAGLFALTLGFVGPGAQAAPPGANVATAVEKDASANGLVTEVHRRYYRYRYYYYPRYRYRYYYYPRYRYRYYYYPRHRYRSYRYYY